MPKQPWSEDEEKMFVKDVASGKKMSDLAVKYNRSETALLLRLKRFVFLNIENGKSESKLAKILNVHSDKIKQFFYEYKGFLETKNAAKNDTLVRASKEIEKQIVHNKTLNNEVNKLNAIVVKMREENMILKEIVENFELTRKVKKLIKKDLLSDDVVHQLKRNLKL